MREQAPPSTQAQALGEQFEYKLGRPVTIRRNQSALLPVVHTGIEGEKVTLYNESLGDSRPRLAVWLKNTSGLTLDGGSFTVIDSNAFAGESLADTINPQERRVLSYALDLGTLVSTSSGTEHDRIDRVEVVRGLMRVSSKLVEKKTYVIRNNDENPRALLLEHAVRPGWTLTDTPRPAESSARYHRFRVEVQPKTTTEFAVREEKIQLVAYNLSDLNTDQVAFWVRQRALDAEFERVLQGVVARKNEISALKNRLEKLGQEQEEIGNDQERVRENLAKLGTSKDEANLRQRYVRQLEQQEDRLGQIRAERARLEPERAAAEKQLTDQLQNLTFERKL